MVVVNGVLFGLLLSVLIGPVFFTVIQTSIERGFEKAVMVAMGIFFSDLSFIFLAYLGVSQVIQKSGYDAWMGYAGGIILVLFGIFSLFKSRRKAEKAAVEQRSFAGLFRYMLKGFLINGISPFVLLFWIGAMSLATLEYRYDGQMLVAFFGIILLVVFLTDIVKAYLALKLKNLITPRLFRTINIVVGIAMIIFGLRMLCYSC